ncbi:MAG TPA: calcium/sodium antiporter [Myxococcota bacterium]|nr:calcium/sodium antiporter [Myxococcota bacterium]
MLAAALLVIAGFAALYQGGNALLSGASGLARALGISPLVVGLTVVAFATSAPELSVSVMAAVDGSPDIAVGNVLGSNIFNTLVAIGAVAALRPIVIDAPLFRREIPLCIVATLMAGGLAWTGGVLQRAEGGVLVAVLVSYLLFVVVQARSDPAPDKAEDGEPEAERDTKAAGIAIVGSLAADFTAFGLPIASALTAVNAHFHSRKGTVTVRVLAVVFGLGLLVFGSEALVNGARTLALAAGISEATVGLTVVAIGTSAPELATALAAAKRGQNAIGVGNALGSNLFNVLGVLGIAALIHPVTVAPGFLSVDLWVALAAVAVLLPFALRGGRVGRAAGASMCLAWIVYTTWLIARDAGTVVG